MRWWAILLFLSACAQTYAPDVGHYRQGVPAVHVEYVIDGEAMNGDS